MHLDERIDKKRQSLNFRFIFLIRKVAFDVTTKTLVMILLPLVIFSTFYESIEKRFGVYYGHL